MIIDYMERYKNFFGVEPICTTLTSADVPIAPGTFDAAPTEAPSARAVRDEELGPVIARAHQENYGGLRDPQDARPAEPETAETPWCPSDDEMHVIRVAMRVATMQIPPESVSVRQGQNRWRYS